LWIGEHEAESALYGSNHEHSAAENNVPVAAEVVARNPSRPGKKAEETPFGL
jgi:hypothetical protein